MNDWHGWMKPLPSTYRFTIEGTLRIESKSVGTQVTLGPKNPPSSLGGHKQALVLELVRIGRVDHKSSGHSISSIEIEHPVQLFLITHERNAGSKTLTRAVNVCLVFPFLQPLFELLIPALFQVEQRMICGMGPLGDGLTRIHAGQIRSNQEVKANIVIHALNIIENED